MSIEFSKTFILVYILAQKLDQEKPRTGATSDWFGVLVLIKNDYADIRFLMISSATFCGTTS